MRTKHLLKSAAALLPAAILAAQLTTASAQGTAFTYQGLLNNGANPANGSYDLTFTLFSVSSGAGQVGSPLTNTATAVSNGLFTVALDFGSQFPGAARWLEIGVRSNSVGLFQTLAPRQQLTPTPYAIYAESANATNLVGTVQSANLAAANIPGVALLAGGNAFTGNQSVMSGSVGIGTITPAKALDVTGTASGVATGASIDPSILVRVSNTASDGNTSSPDFAGIGFGRTAVQQAIVGGTFGNDFLDFYTGGALTAPKMRIDINGTVGILTNDVLEMGYGVAGKEASAGKIGYERFTPDSLDIVGAGTNVPSRKIMFFAEGGATFSGNVFANSFVGGNASGTNSFSGRVGIGTTTPQHKLDVNGNIFLGTQRNGQIFNELGDTLYLGAEQKYLGNTLLSPAGGSTDWINLMANPISAGIMFGLAGPTTTNPHTNTTTLMVIKPSGNVGIGTTTPGSLLTVNGSGSPAISLIGSGTNGQVDIGIAGFATAYSVSAVANDAVIRQSGKGKLFLQTGSGAAAIAITTNNNVGIGTATPNSDSRLQVNGMVRLGSETGTSEAPNRSILVRRVNSTSSATGQVVARSLTASGNIMTLERDGSNGGLILKLTGSNSNGGGAQISGYGITASGTFVGVNIIELANNSSTQIFTDAQRICNCRLSFGEPLNDSDMTTVELMRLVDASLNNDFYWTGTVTSTVNQ